jgi:hypothetical protein
MIVLVEISNVENILQGSEIGVLQLEMWIKL